MAKKMLPARRSNAAVGRAKFELAKVRSTLASTRRKAKESVVPSALMGAGATLAGAAAVGIAGEYLESDELFGVPVEAIGGLIVGTAGVTMGSPLLIHFAAGWMAPYVATMAAELVSAP